RAGERKTGDLAGLVAVKGLHHLESAAPDGIERLIGRHQLARREQLDLELSAGQFSHALDEDFLVFLWGGAAVPEGLHAPLDLVLRARHTAQPQAGAGQRAATESLERRASIDFTH